MNNLFGLLAAGAVVVSGAMANAQGRITVTGHGEVAHPPDMAVISLGASFEADTAAGAVSQVAEALDGTISALEATGVDALGIQTRELSLFPIYDRSVSGAQRAEGFRASSGLSVRVEDLDVLPRILDAVLDEGVNEFGGIEFAISDPTSLEDEARVAAIADARRKAAIMADAAEVSLGPIVTIREAGASGGPVPMMEMATSRASMPVAAGEVSVSVSVTVEWALEEPED